MSRTSVVLQKQKFGFLDDITSESPIDIGVKVVKSMRFFVNDAELQLRGIGAFRTLLSGAMEDQEMLMRMGAGQAILTAMKAHPAEAAVQEPGMFVH